MGEPAVFSIRTELEDRPVTGFDTMIITVPLAVYVHLNGERVLLTSRLQALLRGKSEEGARFVHEPLHHADWVITSDPDVVFTRGLMHDCASCRAGVSAAMQRLVEEPTLELLVGQLYWAKPRE